jgi:hypothetical protein
MKNWMNQRHYVRFATPKQCTSKLNLECFSVCGTVTQLWSPTKILTIRLFQSATRAKREREIVMTTVGTGISLTNFVVRRRIRVLSSCQCRTPRGRSTMKRPAKDWIVSVMAAAGMAGIGIYVAPPGTASNAIV